MKALWVFGILIVLSAVGYKTVANAVVGFWQPLAEVPASPILSSSASLRRNKRDNPTVNLADYLLLHETRDVSASAHATTAVGVCS